MLISSDRNSVSRALPAKVRFTSVVDREFHILLFLGGLLWLAPLFAVDLWPLPSSPAVSFRACPL